MASSEFKALTAGSAESGFQRTVTTLSSDDLPTDGVLVEVEWSSVNFKDGLAASPDGRVARIDPLVPGIDLAGRLAEDAGAMTAGTPVLAHGYDIGVSRHGGFAGLARVPQEWLVPLPPGLTSRDAMVVGTAGFTAALSVVALEEQGLAPGAGQVLVTGASGGVGSIAVAILATRGYDVVASTGKDAAHEYLRSLGASEVVDRSVLSEPGKPLESTRWAGAVDCVGGATLAGVLSRLSYGAAVAASGLTGGSALSTTVMPFILRAVSLLGVDSVQTSMDRRRQVWERIGSDLRPSGIDRIGHDIGLDDLDSALSEILSGGVTGRYVVDLSR
jgi:putative YhdH/YhfP family quinone oxidoreductase